MKERNDYLPKIINIEMLDNQGVIEASKAANERIAEMVDMEGILKRINQEYFEGYGKILPAKSYLECVPDNEGEAAVYKSFMKTKVSTETVTLRQEIDIYEWLLNMEKRHHIYKHEDGKYKFGVFQLIDFEKQSYVITLFFANVDYYSETHSGNFDKHERPLHLYWNSISERLEFNLHNPPKKEDLTDIINQNAVCLFERLKNSCIPYFKHLPVKA